jgi:hypothetical protein
MLNLALQFKEFVKNPVLAFTFLALLAVSYLYLDNKMVYESQITRQEQRIDKLEKDVQVLQEKLLECVASVNK